MLGAEEMLLMNAAHLILLLCSVFQLHDTKGRFDTTQMCDFNGLLKQCNFLKSSSA